MVSYFGRCVEVCWVFVLVVFLVRCHMKFNLPEVLKLVYVYT